MKHWQIFILSILIAISLGGLKPIWGEAIESKAPLFIGMGNHHHSITTKSPAAQKYFDQGLALAYGFNHAEAARSFRQAIKLDPDCAMCNWGLAYVLGPNINAKMEDDAVPESYQAIQKATELAENSTEPEQAYIKALASRYTDRPLEDRSTLDLAFAREMKQVSEKYPEDLDAATLYAEALMDTMPWDYWTETKEPKPETQIVIDTLESILERNPYHPAANHLYIHAMEAVKPKAAEAAADRLGKLIPGSGHLVHMPSHIYIRVGRYHDAAQANQKAIAVDNDYITQCHAQGVYPLAYMPHNHHFLWFAAVMEGNSELAAEAGKSVAGMVDPEIMRTPGMGTLQHFYSVPLFTKIRFGQWKQILNTPAPAIDLKYPMGVWHYARGLAYNAQGKIDLANQELKQLKTIVRDPELESVTIWDINTTQNILNIAVEVLTGEVAARKGNYNLAISHLSQAVTLEDDLNYDEPADWSTPARQYLGAVFIQDRRYEEAKQAYQEDLAIYPDNGWSLFGLWQALKAEGKSAEAIAIKQQFDSAWQDADVELTASKF